MWKEAGLSYITVHIMVRLAERNLGVEKSEQLSAYLLRGKFAATGIKDVVFDLDGTILDTPATFVDTIFDIAGILKHGRGWMEEKGMAKLEWKEFEDVLELYQRMNEIIWGLRGEYGVRPSIMEETTKRAALKLGLGEGNPKWILAMHRVRQLYEYDVPKVFEGAVGVVDLVRASGARTLLLTHAGFGWTQHKLKGSGLEGKFDRVVCFRVDRPKSEQWPGLLSELGTLGEGILSIGDNFGADIVPVVRGGGKGILVVNGQSDVWGGEKASQWGDISRDNFIVVDRIGGVVDAIITAKF